jgi:hypothetical protein
MRNTLADAPGPDFRERRGLAKSCTTGVVLVALGIANFFGILFQNPMTKNAFVRQWVCDDPRNARSERHPCGRAGSYEPNLVRQRQLWPRPCGSVRDAIQAKQVTDATTHPRI